jgi:bla regulator protein blaR1
MIPPYLVPVFNHLWQSTLICGAAWLLTKALRNNAARVRYAIWMAASLKFVVPFSLLVQLGNDLPLHSAAAAPVADLPAIVAQVATPFEMRQLNHAVRVPRRPMNSLGLTISGIWCFGVLITFVSWFRRWLRMRKMLRSATRLRLPELPFPAYLCDGRIEPGIFGIIRPALLLPTGIFERLNPEQVQTVLAHEIAHVRRRDNLTIGIHMFIHSLFWFYPVVRFIGMRLVEEREQACDEIVLRSGVRSVIYAEAIINTCKLYVSAPLFSAAVTGACLKQRIGRILANTVGVPLTAVAIVSLTTLLFLMLALPIAFGILDVRVVRAQSAMLRFDAAVVKPNPAGGGVQGGCRGIDSKLVLNDRKTNVPLGRCTIRSATAGILMAIAYDVPTGQISGGPDWFRTGTTRYDVEGTAADPATATEAQLQTMLQQLLLERFKLQFHRVAQAVPGYALVVDRGSPKLQPAAGDGVWSYGVTGSPAAPPVVLIAKRASLAELAKTLSATNLCFEAKPTLAPVIDNTNLRGAFDFTLRWDPCRGNPADFTGTALPNALKDQLGLRLEPARIPQEFFVVDYAEKPQVR